MREEREADDPARVPQHVEAEALPAQGQPRPLHLVAVDAARGAEAQRALERRDEAGQARRRRRRRPAARIPAKTSASCRRSKSSGGRARRPSAVATSWPRATASRSGRRSWRSRRSWPTRSPAPPDERRRLEAQLGRERPAAAPGGPAAAGRGSGPGRATRRTTRSRAPPPGRSRRPGGSPAGRRVRSWRRGRTPHSANDSDHASATLRRAAASRLREPIVQSTSMR